MRDQLRIQELLEHDEGPWLEFKHNNSDPEMIGKRISAIANATALSDKPCGYMLWGIEDGTRTVVGTEFAPSNKRVGNQGLAIWLSNKLSPKLDFKFEEIIYNDKRLVLLTIPTPTSLPIEFDRTSYIRIGDATPRLSDYPDKMANLIDIIRPFRWEKGIAMQFVSGDDVLQNIDYVSFFRLINQPLPDNRNGIFNKLSSENIIECDVRDHWNIFNFGAILFATDLNNFDGGISRKGIRFIKYDGPNRASQVVNRQDGKRGYASGFDGLTNFISNLIPSNEEIGLTFRKENPMLPRLAIRELVANALIHQDMTITGAGPMIELFNNRMEITNPGKPLIEPNRMIDMPPQSRNETIASLMRRMGFCEEQGSGLDKVIHEVEECQLSAPDFRSDGNSTKVVLFGAKLYADMTGEERVRACYQHAVLKYLSGERMRNKTLCERLGIELRNAAQASGVINNAIEQHLIRHAEEGNARAGYVPFWA